MRAALHHEHAIAELLSSKLQIEVPTLDTDLMETGALDSMKLVDLLLTIEQEFGIELSLENIELEEFRSVRTIYRMLQRNFSASEAA